MKGVLLRLAQLVRDQTGNALAPERFGLLEEVGQRRASRHGLADLEAYAEALAAGQLPGEWDALVAAITIKESYFFRAPQQFEAIERQLVPSILKARAGERRLRVWSAACARGEEAATLAMVLADMPALAGWDWRILATDLDAEALAIAERGLYGERAIAQVPAPTAARYLKKNGKFHELDPRLRERIDYRQLNLVRPPYGLPDRWYDLILLRNVLIYFRRPLQRKVLEQVGAVLAPEGSILLGASETLWQIQDELEAVDLGGCFAYRHPRPAAAGAPGAIPGAIPARKPARRTSLAPMVPPAAVSRPPRSAAVAASAPPVRPAVPLAARASLASPTTPTAAPVASVRELARAAADDLATNRLEEAARALAVALEQDPSDAAVHSLQGFLYDVSARPDQAVASYRAALYLDPTLFQPRLLLADCLRRMGVRDRAERLYREVLAMLESSRERRVEEMAGLPVPDREGALRRCREALRRGAGPAA